MRKRRRAENKWGPFLLITDVLVVVLAILTYVVLLTHLDNGRKVLGMP